MTDPSAFEDEHEYITLICTYCGHQVTVPVYCGNRFCNICCAPRRKRVRDRLKWLIQHRKNVTGTMIKHLTLTVRNDPDLVKMTKHLIKSFRKMRNRRYWKECVVGGAFVVELTNKGNYWHAHLHIIIQSFRIDIKRLMSIWFQCSGGNTGVYIKNIPPARAVWYLTKYVTKSDLDIEDQKTASEALKNFRLFNPFGQWYAINAEYKVLPSPCTKCGISGCYLPAEIIYGIWERH